ncbi:hypothetical protein BG011_007746 [Mortierella polycephala]|uniref:Uncharacterized protein n=1 Tax=Mortierella polycephala TaxID=41804 RepID=A0A9P6PR60_9FUNG|nr:hypothetical protein BG011_007746 [Mortierella polycephala]
MFNTSHLHITSERSDRFSCQASLPCMVLPQAGTVPLMLNLALKRNATTITKVAIELLESVFALDASDPNRVTDVLIDERLVTRQNCPLQDWPASMSDEPIAVSKRLMFKVPVLPLTTWSKPEETLSHFRSGLDRGLCHSSGTHPLVNVRIAHSVRIIIEVKGLSEDAESKVEYDSGEAVTNVWIVGNQEYQDDDSHPPSYYRSFSTALVEGDKIQEMDQLTIEALQDDLLPPCYEDSIGSSSTLSSPTLTNISETSFDQVSWHEDLPGNTDAPSYSYPVLVM